MLSFLHTLAGRKNRHSQIKSPTCFLSTKSLFLEVVPTNCASVCVCVCFRTHLSRDKWVPDGLT
jgi:hypothetical protein